MKILIFHGYLLRGTGSNIYNNNLAQALAGLGHEVHLLCQDREAGDFNWVDKVGCWRDGALEVERIRESDSPGSVTVYRPEIGLILPVYVEDPYEGFDARAFPTLDDEQINHYIEANVNAVREIVGLIGGADVALANHLIMGPVIFARADVKPYVVKNHGSDLEYTVKVHPDRFVPFAREGLEPAESVLVGSFHTAASLWDAVPMEGLKEKTGLGPPGVDTGDFMPLVPADRSAAIKALAKDIENGSTGTSFGRNKEDAVQALNDFADATGPRVIFVGKLIVSKGVDLLVAAWPIIHAANPGAHLLLAGFGAYEMGLRALVTALGDGDLEAIGLIAKEGRGLEGGESSPLRYLTAFLEDLPAGYPDMAVAAAGTISFSGRLEHDEVARVDPAADVMVVPSTFPEAFGMVAAEAAASGVLPVCAEHSGLAEVTGVLADEVEDVKDLLGFQLGPGAVSGLADNVNSWLAKDEAGRIEAGQNIAECADRNWSWTGVAKDLISACEGKVRPVIEP